MDPSALASKLRRMHTWMESGDRPSLGERYLFDRPPFGRAEVTIDATSTAPAASYNRNRIQLCGSEGGLTQQGLVELTRLFDAKQVGRFFVWLSPGPELDLVREWLAALDFVKVPWTRYPTLMHTGEPTPPVHCDFAIREVDGEEIASARSQLGELLMDGFAESVGRKGFHHYMAFDAGRPIAVGALVQFEDIGYLTWAATEEAHQRRGAQSALIAHRVEQALALGCTQIVSQTLTMLTQSLANLQRAGFREVYEQEVYERVRG
ncbi:MAG TPA: GNAT family N-acetyltransferase [Steroidobacteraceae bacterium]|nr:GNAT family N-acetyltransferase [Steroidobacteraceae bacterium]